MQILYGYSNCTDATYNRIVAERGVSALLPDQKYHGLMIKGLSENGANVRCFSGLPINRAVTKRVLIREKDEQEGNAHYHYITTLNLPVIRQLMVFFGTFFGLLGIKKTEDTYALCDFLNIASSMAFIAACRLRRIKRAAIVTDLPDMFDVGSMSKRIRNSVLRRFDAYVILTEYMSEYLPQNKPYIVLEGHVDATVPAPDERRRYENTDGKKVILYAGSLQEKYGIRMLTEGFLKADIPDTELWIYGRGDFDGELKRLSGEHPGIRYHGVRPNTEIVDAEQRASLLVNPRPSAPVYTKYSFPSKNMEYMVSGTPMMTTPLPGMPDEYRSYVYLIEDETPEGVARALKRFFDEPADKRFQKGAAARRFVLEHKSNAAQAEKIIRFLDRLS